MVPAFSIAHADLHAAQEYPVTNRQDYRFGQPTVAPNGWRAGRCAKKTDVEIERTAEAVNQGHRAGMSGRMGQTGLTGIQLHGGPYDYDRLRNLDDPASRHLGSLSGCAGVAGLQKVKVIRVPVP